MHFKYLKSSLHHLLSEAPNRFSIYIDGGMNGTFTLHADKARKAASIAKLFIMVEAFRQKDVGELSLDELVQIDDSVKVGGSGVINYLSDPPNYSYLNLLELMIIVSDNTASNILLDKVGLDNINQMANQIGCEQTKIARKFMDFDAASKGVENYTSASDINKLLHVILDNGSFLSEKSRKQILAILANQQFNHKLFGHFTDDLVFYHKTGEIVGTEHDAGILNFKNKTINVTILSEGWNNNRTAQKYFSEIGKIIYSSII